MSSLFIIGNGFDRAHGLPTSYEDFRNYLLDEYPNADQDSLAIPETITLPDGGDGFANSDDLVGFFLKVITEAEPYGDKWCDIETSLGLLDFDNFLDDWSDDEDDNEWHEVYKNEDRAISIAKSILAINDYFSDWIDTIEIDEAKPKPDFKTLIDNETDCFLTFNYTVTLEELYDVKKVCHIHGKQGENLLFGHGNDTSSYDYYMENYVGSENELDEAHRQLRKDTTKAINDNIYFFNTLNGINKIYSYGFSFSDVDMIYIREICTRVPTNNVTWYLSNFDNELNRNEFCQRIRDSGFKGNFDIFSVR